MKKILVLSVGALFCLVSLFGVVGCGKGSKANEYDIVVYGGTSAGIIAGYTAKQLGKSVLVIEAGNHLGGLTTGGLGATDIGNKYAVTGLAKDFYRRIGAHYGKFEQWTFEPHVAQQVYDDYIRKADLEIVKLHRLKEVKKEGDRITEIVVENAESPDASTDRAIKAKMFIDATYEGDLLAKAGVSYTVGRESNEQYGETYNGVQMSLYHQLPDGVDPYKVKGKPESGLLWGVADGTLAPAGSGDKLVQAYNFRLCLTQDAANKIPFTKPEGYDSTHYELLLRILEKETWTTVSSSYTRDTLAGGRIVVNHSGNYLIKAMPNGKTDANNFGGFSTDMIGANYDYPEADYATRARIWKEHEIYTKGLLYFMANDSRVPEHVRKDMGTWGYTKDEFKDHGGFSPQLYVREARRMVSDLVMTQHHCQGREVVEDGIGMAAYGMDSHNCQRIVVNGMVKNEGDVQIGLGVPYPISYRSIVPKKSECSNLFVPICLSASHIAFGSIRMEPVFMVLGQTSAVAAAMAIDGGVSVQDIDVKKLQASLLENPLADGSQPEILVDNDHPQWVEKSGNWLEKRGGYGRSHLELQAKADAADFVRYTPEVSRDGEYEIFMYFSNFDRLADEIAVKVTTATGEKEVNIKTGEVQELGLPSGDWISLGKYNVQKGKSASVTVLGKGNSKDVVADALIWRPVR
ncbi:FAD-dependent oxidoreductase [Ravibacter arvi]|uniref:FAD-dependent oxidoreductase n=1 Tax=Ravibacter arvi TaxID=2051041 RepID=A0ABP8MA24_9BACT